MDRIRISNCTEEEFNDIQNHFEFYSNCYLEYDPDNPGRGEVVIDLPADQASDENFNKIVDEIDKIAPRKVITASKTLDKKKYTLPSGMYDYADPKNICEQVIMAQDTFLNIREAITEMAAENVSIYNAELWAEAQEFETELNEVLQEYECRDMIELLSRGQAKYYEKQAYHNIDEIIYNYAAEHLNLDYGPLVESLNSDEREALAETLEDELADIDDSNTYGDIVDRVSDIVFTLTEQCDAQRQQPTKTTHRPAGK